MKEENNIEEILNLIEAQLLTLKKFYPREAELLIQKINETRVDNWDTERWNEALNKFIKTKSN